MALEDRLLVLLMLVAAAIPLVIVVMLGRERIPRVQRGEIKMADIAIAKTAWPERAQLLSNAFDNQFQLPVLFYLGGLLALYLGASWIEVLLAAGFVLSRVVHAAIHVISNNVPQRLLAYSVGFVLLCALLIEIAVRMIAGGF